MAIAPNLLVVPLMVLMAIASVSCGREPASAARGQAKPSRIVLYVSADDALYRPVIQTFEAASGAKVEVVPDTEATKTFGLVRKLLDEKDAPKADLFWASEPVGVVRLAKEGVLGNLAIADRQGKAVPAQWVPLGYRARVIVYHKLRFKAGEEPRRLGDLLAPELKGKVGLARPQFGTTRTHFAALLAAFGEEAYQKFLIALRDNGAKVYDGNSMVVQAVAQGEISAGLTDSDDVESGRQQGWAVSARGGTADIGVSKAGDGAGPVLMMPHVVAVVARQDASEEQRALASRFVSHLLSDEVQTLLLRTHQALQPSEAGGLPRIELPPEARARAGDEMLPDYREVEPFEAKAVEIFERVWRDR
ncbi:MAG TPA: extracellular solute-binding protein [Phycisphaerales bacterium]